MDTLQAAAGILLLVGLLAGAVFLLRRGGAAFQVRLPWRPQQAGDDSLERSSWLVLTHHHSLHSIRWRGGHYLVAVHPDGVQIIDRQSSTGFNTAFSEAVDRAVPPEGGIVP